MADHNQLINKFYTAFAKLDAEEMASCYHDEIIFSDPAFGELKSDRAKAMWKMLIERSEGKLEIRFSNIRSDDRHGSANWEASYVFSRTKRKVLNKIRADFEFKDGKIVKHTDHFDLWKWARQALGLAGLLMGFTAYFQKKIQAKAKESLEQYINRIHLNKQ